LIFFWVLLLWIVKLEDGAQHKNLRIFSVSTGEELASFTQKSQENWDLQYTISESHAIRLVSQEIQVFKPAEWSKGIVDKLKVEGATSIALSPGLNPSVAVFVAEKKVWESVSLTAFLFFWCWYVVV
jgi:translation initiation factor 2A